MIKLNVFFRNLEDMKKVDKYPKWGSEESATINSKM